MKNLIMKIFVIVVTIFLLTETLCAQKIDDNFVNHLCQKLSISNKITSIDFIVFKDRGIFNKPKTFMVRFSFSNDSLKLIMYYHKCDEYISREVYLIEEGIEEDITYLVKGIKLNRWFRRTQRELKDTPPGVYTNKANKFKPIK